MANRRQAKKNAAAAVNKEVVKKEAKAVETAEAVKAEETAASVKEETAVPVKKEAAEKAEQPKKAPMFVVCKIVVCANINAIFI